MLLVLALLIFPYGLVIQAASILQPTVVPLLLAIGVGAAVVMLVYQSAIPELRPWLIASRSSSRVSQLARTATLWRTDWLSALPWSWTRREY